MEWGMKEQENMGVTFLTFPLLEREELVTHAFSTRKGGVSEGMFATMNFAGNRGDDPEHVRENYRRMGAALGVPPEQMVLSQQTHTTNLRIVTREDAGKGVVRERDYTDVDGLLTDEPGLMLVTSYADCVPLFFLDPVKRVIALSHSGWRGTVGRMGAVTVERMHEVFGCDPGQILACIGPSICQSCYEVSEDVAEEFRLVFPEADWPEILEEKPEKKYQLDLWNANRKILLSAGIREDHLASSGICTCCHSDFLFSHRATQGKRGNLGAFLMLNS